MCLEEALAVSVEAGALFYAQTRRRQVVVLDEPLRELTEHTAASLHAMIRAGRTPIRAREKKCDLCSLLPACLPPRRSQASVEAYLRRSLASSEQYPEEI
jgi:CRISPR-associated exonuclease Cas4